MPRSAMELFRIDASYRMAGGHDCTVQSAGESRAFVVDLLAEVSKPGTEIVWIDIEAGGCLEEDYAGRQFRTV